MVSANIGSAWISVVPETSKIAPELKKAIGSAEKSAGKTGSNIGSKISSGISKTLKVGAASVGVAAGGVLAASITKGLGRLSGIENAQAKLSGLGHEAEGVSAIMEDALVSVKGTAYGLEDAATVAASAVAAGVKPGKDLQRTLKLTGDAANIAGIDISAMGSIVNKVATSDMMQMDVANQLMDAGIPILQMVAEEMGVTAEEARKLASDGEISFEIFQSALEEGVGGAALKAGETVQGSFANMGAAAGRFGAALADPVFKAAPALFSAVGSVFDDINDAIGPAAERIGQLLTPALENVAGLMESRVSPRLAQGAEKLGDFAVLLTEKAVDPSMWERVGEVFGSIRDTAERLWPSLESLAKSFFTIAQNISAATWEALGAALNAIAPLVESVLVPLVETVADIAEQNPKAVQALVLAFLGFKGVGAISGPVSSAAKTIGGLGEAFSTTRTLIGAGGVVEGVKELGKYSGDANPVLAKMGGGVASFGKKSGTASKFLSPLIKGIGSVVRMINPWVAGITVAVGTLTWFFTKTELGQKVFGKLVEWVTVAWDKITEVFTAGVDWVVDKWDSFTGWISGAWSGITSLFKGDFTADLADAFGISDDNPVIVWFFHLRDAVISVGEGFKEAWEAIKTGNIVEAIASIFGGVKDAIPHIWDGIVDLALSAWDGVKILAPKLWDAVKSGAVSAWENISQTVSDAWDSTWNYVKETASKFTWDNIKSSASSMWDSVKDGASSAWAQVETTASSTWESVKNGASGIWDNVKNGASSAWSETKRIANINWDSIKDYASSGWETAWGKISSGASSMWGTVSEKASEMRTDLREKARDAFDWASDNKITSGPVNAVAGVIKGVRSKWDELVPKMQPIKDAATDLWGTLTGDGEGPTEERSGLAGLVDSFSEKAADLQEKVQPVKDAASDLWKALTGKAEDMSGDAQEGIAGIISDFSQKIADLQEKVQPAKDAIKSVWNALTGRDDEGQLVAEDGEKTGIAGMVSTITEKINEFRDSAQPVIDRFKEKWGELKDAMEPMLDNIKEKLGTIAKYIGGATLVVALGLLVAPFVILAGAIYGALTVANWLADGFGWVAEKWGELRDKLGEGWTWIDENVIQPFKLGMQLLWIKILEVVDWIKGKWQELQDKLTLAWYWVRDNVLIPFKAGLQELWNKTLEVVEWIKNKWQDLQDKLSAVWSWIDQYVIQPFKQGLTDLWNRVLEVVDWVKNKWQEMGDKLGAVWSWVDNNVFTPLKNGLDVVKGWFETTVNAIGETWNWLKEKTAKPINFVIDTVYNNGIRTAWNAVAGLVGMDDKKLGKIDKVTGFASGGVLPGYSPGVDNHMFYSPTGGRLALSGGEAIMRPEWTRAVGGPAAVDRMNRAARNGSLPVEKHDRRSAAHAAGGVLDFGAFASGGVIGAMINIVKQKYPQLSMTSGLRPGDSGYHGMGLATDWSNGSGNTPAQLALAHDIAATYPGSAQLIYDSPGWAGNIWEGQPAGAMNSGVYTTAEAGRHDHHVHWAMTTPPTMPFGGGVFEGGSDGGGGGGGFWQAITGTVKRVWDGIIDKIPGYGSEPDPTGGPFGDFPGAFLKKAAGAVWDFAKSAADKVMEWVGGGNSGSVDVSGISGPVVDQVEAVFAKHGFTGAEWDAAKWIIQKESNWSTTATNPSSGAFGLFQFNPMGGDTLGTYLPSRSTDPAVQGDAGARYIKDRYGTPTAAKAFWEQNGWYDKGGVLETGTTLVQNDTGKPEAVLNPWQWQVFNRAVESMPMLSESLKMVAKEIGGAFLGNDFGYGELAHVLRNEEWARAIVDGSVILGNISRDVGAALVPVARAAGEDYLATQATSALDVVGLGGLVPIGLKAGEAAWDAYQASPVDVGFNGHSVVVEIEAESDDDLVRVRQLKDMADRVHGLEVKVNEKKRPVAARATRGGAM